MDMTPCSLASFSVEYLVQPFLGLRSPIFLLPFPFLLSCAVYSFTSENGDSRPLWNIGTFLPEYMASLPRRQYSYILCHENLKSDKK
jgi:hypothetical protein